MITATGLTKKYHKTTVLDNVSFTINNGTIVGIVGSNGAGKSTLISMIASIIKPTKGDIVIKGGRIGYVPQEITLFPNLTVKENLTFWDTISNSHHSKKRKENIEHIIQVANLEDYFYKKVSQLSGGLKRRLNIAVSLLSHPNILIMDEPTVGMDISSRSEIVAFIKALSSDGTTVIYVSHHADEIEKLCTHILCLNQGHLVFNGTKDKLKSLYPGEEMHDIIFKISSSTTLDERGGNETHNIN
ncbi:MAG TPA: ABC transporter ATP-binding protein [Epulopiscium sp.]|nr:ABC transporter ATP-binding protein [Candidatus Epulonipiscium sp.]